MKLIPRNYFDDMFDDFMAPSTTNAMRCDVYEKDGNYNIEVEVPGYKKEDIKIESKDGYLTITAHKKFEEKDEGKNYIHHERRYGKIERSFYIGDLKADNIKAKFEDGILKVTVPKVEEHDDKRIIEIE